MNINSLSRIKFLAFRGGTLLLMLALLTASLGPGAGNVQAASPSAGAFMAHPTTPFFGAGSSIPNDVVLGDIDDDGDLDAVVAEGDPTLPDTVWLNDGDGNFTYDADLGYLLPTEMGNSKNGHLVDIDTDGDLDILLSSFEAPNGEHIWKNTGSGTFNLFTTFNSYDLTHWTAVGDLTGDTDLDVLAAQSTIGVFDNDGTGLMTELHAYVIGTDVYHAALADVDVDGDLDAFVTSTFGISVSTNDGAGDFTTAQSFGVGPTRVALAGALDNNASVDFISGRPTGAQLYTNNGTGTFAATGSAISTHNIYGGAIGDINGDGYLDVVLANTDSVNDEIFVNDGTGVFSANPATPTVPAGLDTRAARLADIDGDDDLDLLTTYVDPSGVASGVNVWLNNAAPVVSAIADQDGEEGVLFELNLAGEVTDPDGDSLTFSNASPGNITSGGSFTWTPGETHGGTTVTVTFDVSDGAVTVSGSFDVAVVESNLDPVISHIDDGNGSEGALFSLNLAPFVNDPDGPEEDLVFSNASPGSVNADGLFTWTPGETHGGTTVEVTFDVSDVQSTVSGSFNVIVAETNQAPVVSASIPDQTTDEGVEVTLNLNQAPYVTDADVPAQTLNFALTGGSVGSLTTGGVFTWTPGESYGGTTVTVTFTVTDSMGGSDSGSFDVIVTEVNQAPVVSSIPNQTGEEGTPFSLNLAPYASDPDGNALEFGSPSVGSLTDAGVFTWTPGEIHGGAGQLTVTFTVTDGIIATPVSGSFNITVAEDNVAPVVGAIPDQAATEGQEFELNLNQPSFVSDADLPAQALTFSSPSVGSLTTAGVFTWTPGEEFGGYAPITVTFTVTDSLGGSAQGSFVVSVSEVNQAPELVTPDDGTYMALVPIEIVVSGSDADDPAQTLSYGVIAASLPAGASFDDATDTFTWTPTKAQIGVHTITFTVSDGVTTVETEVDFTINEPLQIFLPLISRNP